jgi:tetratricopeptide (TPR) repeat protein
MNQEVRLLFHELADLSPGEREQVFRDRQIGSELRAEVESLLGFDSTSNQYLTDGVSNAAQELLRSASGRELSYCGQYRLVRLLGSGGMGVVYLAERTDGEIQQQVAVKLLGAHGHRAVWRDRFLKERQFLASLNHPSIVHVIDAGHTEDGRPYLVMEYVEGTTIDVYASRIDVRDQLALFLRVCEGVSHAHRHLIIHRDLKPSNILVDAAGQPKLLDFGIAKLLDQTGDPTQTVERLLTPNYASPEQLRGTQQTTATDVYSLGAVLYKLLTEQSPHESDTHTSQAIEVIAGTRKIPPPTRLNPNLPADLDYILQKALRNEPDERYASVEVFAADIAALLESRPVAARSGNRWYRTRKFLRRHWVPVAAAVLVIASLSAGLYVVNRERAIAQRRFVDVRQLANKLFDIDVQARQLTGSTKTRQLIVDTSLEYLRRLAADAHGDSELALEIGNAYMRVARVEGVPTSPNLGQMGRADKDLQVAEGFVHSVLVSQPANRTALLRSAQIAHDRMILAFFNGHRDEALALARKSEMALEEFHAGKGDETEAQPVLATYLNLAHQYVRSEQFGDALRICDHAIQIGRSLNIQSYIGNFYWVKAEVFQKRGDADAALKAVRESTRLLDPGADEIGQGQQTMGFVQALSFEGKILGQDSVVSVGRYEEAAASLGRSFTIVDGFVHRDSNDQFSRNRLADAGVNLGDVLRHFDARRSLDIYDHTLRHLAEVQNNSAFRRFEVSALAGSSYSLRRLNRPADARQRLDAAFERLRQLKLYPAEKVEPGSEAEDALRALAEYEAGTGNLKRATELYQNVLDLTQAANSNPENSLTDALDQSSLYRAKSALLRRTAQADLASALEARDRELWQRWDRKLPHNPFVLRQIEAARVPLRSF